MQSTSTTAIGKSGHQEPTGNLNQARSENGHFEGYLRQSNPKHAGRGEFPSEDEEAEAHDVTCIEKSGNSSLKKTSSSFYTKEISETETVDVEDCILTIRRNAQNKWVATLENANGKPALDLGLFDTEEEATRAYDASTRWEGKNFDDNDNNLDVLESKMITNKEGNASSSVNEQTINDGVDFQLKDNETKSHSSAKSPEQRSRISEGEPNYDSLELLHPHAKTSSIYDDHITSNPFSFYGSNGFGDEFGVEGNGFYGYESMTFLDMDATEEETMFLGTGWPSHAPQAFENNEEFYDNQILYQNPSPPLLNNNQGLEGSALNEESSMMSTENQGARNGLRYEATSQNSGDNFQNPLFGVEEEGEMSESPDDFDTCQFGVEEGEMSESPDDFDTDQFFVADQETDVADNLE